MSNEKGIIRKDPGGKLNIALVYPNTYWIGMSNLGVHTIYRVLNEHPGIVCERFFMDTPRSVESLRALSDFHIIAFSISYELDLINMIKILLKNRIPIRATSRKGKPFIIAGGATLTLNPEPVAEAMDICFLGDGENVADVLYQAFTTGDTYEKVLDILEGKDGIYIPSRTYPVVVNGVITGFKGPTPVISVLEPIATPAHTHIITRNTVFGDMFLVEIARGCPWGCKFCSARQIYQPFRPMDIKRLKPLFEQSTESGLKVGLVSTAINDHPDVPLLYNTIIGLNAKIAPPSLRPGMITDDLLGLLKLSQVKGVTLAPEAGSQELRYSIGKRIGNDTILSDIHTLVSSGIRDIKLYFIIGLPNEDLSHIDDTIDLIRRIRQTFIKVSRGNKKLGHVSVNINTMVAKPHTPYERLPMLDLSQAKDRIRRIVKGLKGMTNISISFEGPKWAHLQAILARGDRMVLNLIIELAKHETNEWKGILIAWPKNPDYYVLRRRPKDEVLPWSFYRHPDIRNQSIRGSKG